MHEICGESPRKRIVADAALLEKRQSDLHPRSIHTRSSDVTSQGSRSPTCVQLSKSNTSVTSLDYNSSIVKDSDCVISDVVKGDSCSLNPPLIQSVNQHKGRISDPNNDDDGNLQSGDSSLSLPFSHSSGQTVNQEKIVHFFAAQNTVEEDRINVDSKALVGVDGLQDYKELDDMGDFDIDDFSENDIPDYCEEPAVLSVSGCSTALPRPLCEGRLSNSYDKKSVATTTPVVNLSKPRLYG